MHQDLGNEIDTYPVQANAAKSTGKQLGFSGMDPGTLQVLRWETG